MLHDPPSPLRALCDRVGVNLDLSRQQGRVSKLDVLVPDESLSAVVPFRSQGLFPATCEPGAGMGRVRTSASSVVSAPSMTLGRIRTAPLRVKRGNRTHRPKMVYLVSRCACLA